MSNPKEIVFKLLNEENGYGIYYAIPTRLIKTGNEKTVMFVIKDNIIVYILDSTLDQFHMKKVCDEFIEKEKNK